MKRELLSIICCPLCKGHLELRNVFEQDGEVESGLLHCIPCAESYPVVRFIPRFVPVDNYATNFGLQWNRFRQTQLDSHSRLPISRERFFRQTGWSPNDLVAETRDTRNHCSPSVRPPSVLPGSSNWSAGIIPLLACRAAA